MAGHGQSTQVEIKNILVHSKRYVLRYSLHNFNERLTSNPSGVSYNLRVNMVDQEGNFRRAEYGNFKIGDEDTGY